MKNLKGLLKNNVKLADSYCANCGSQLHNFKLGKTEKLICKQCATQKKVEQDEQLEKQWADESLEARATQYFKRNSIFNNTALITSGFKNLDTTEPQVNLAKETALRFISKTLEGDVIHFLLSGDTGVGKSHIAMATARAIVTMSGFKKKVLFIHYASYLSRVRRSYDYPELKQGIHKVTDEMARADVLVLDDLGVELGDLNNPTPATRANIETLNLLLESRENKPLIVTTNLSEKQIKKYYGERNHSRIINHTKGFKILMNQVTDKRKRE